MHIEISKSRLYIFQSYPKGKKITQFKNKVLNPMITYEELSFKPALVQKIKNQFVINSAGQGHGTTINC